MSMFVKQFATAAAHQNRKVTLTRRCCISTRTSKLSAPGAVIQATNISLTAASPLPPPISSSSYQMNSRSTIKKETSSTKKRRSNRSLQQFSSVTSSSIANNEDSTMTTDNSSSGESLIDFDILQKLASQPLTPVRLADMYKYATMPNQRLRNAQFLKKEMTIRMAHRAVDLLTLPHGLKLATPIQNVAHTYLSYLRRLLDLEIPKTLADDDGFTELLRTILLDRTSIPMEIARGITTWRDNRREELGPKESQELEDALVRFFTARVGLRLLTEHHILSSPKHASTSKVELLLRNCKINKSYNAENNDNSSSNPELGCIRTKYDPVVEVRKVAAEVTRQTLDLFGVCPKIDIRDCSSSTANFTYVPHHLQYMLVELLKNSCKATVLKHRHRPQHTINNNNNTKDEKKIENELPAIRVVIAKGKENISIQISDRGGGVPRSIMHQIFQFGYVGKSNNSGSNNNLDDDIPPKLLEKSDFGRDIITGDRMRGFGLPLARIYARYFGGELTLKSMEGYGLDVYLYLPRLGDACENLPLSVRASPGEHTSLPVPSLFGTANVPNSSTAPSTASPSRSSYTNKLERESRRRHMLEILSQRAL